VNSVSGQGTQINVGNPDLQPEVSTSTEVGVHYDSLRGWTAGLTAFHNRISDKISSTTCAVNMISSCLVQGANANSSYPVNLDSATTQGLERSEEHTSELQSRENLVCRLLLEK